MSSVAFTLVIIALRERLKTKNRKFLKQMPKLINFTPEENDLKLLKLLKFVNVSGEFVPSVDFNFDPSVINFGFHKFGEFFFPQQMNGIKEILMETNPFTQALWDKLNNCSCTPLELQDLCEVLYQYLVEYDFAIVMISLKNNLAQDKPYLEKMEKLLNYYPPDEIIKGLVTEGIIEITNKKEIKMLGV